MMRLMSDEEVAAADAARRARWDRLTPEDRVRFTRITYALRCADDRDALADFLRDHVNGVFPKDDPHD